MSQRRSGSAASAPASSPGGNSGGSLERWIARRPSLALLAGLLIAVAWCFLIYAPSLSGPFLFDDIPNIERNLQIRVDSWSLDKLVAVFADSLQTRRPVVNFTFAVNYYLHGYDVWGYRVFNICVHVMNGLLVYLLARATLNSPALLGRYPATAKIALTAAAVFLVHPVATQSVAYVVQRMTSVATFFYLLSLLCYARWRLGGARPHLLLIGALVSAIAALGSKEFTATLPVVILLFELYFVRDLVFPPWRRSLPVVVVGLVAVTLLSLLFLDSGDPVQRVLGGYGRRDFTLGERLLTEARVVVHYLGLFVLPYPGRLNLDYDFPLSISLLEPVTTLPALVCLAGLGLVAIAISRKHRLAGFAILWFLATQVIESTVIPLEIAYEHRTYLSFVYLFIAMAAAACSPVVNPRIRAAFIGFVLVLFSFWTWQRAAVWGDPIALWSDVVEKSPGKARPHNNLGAVLREAGRDLEAIPHFERAIAIKPDYRNPYQSLGDIYYRMDDPQRALGYFEESVRLAPGDADGHKNLAVALDDLYRVDEAIHHYEEAIRLDPNAVEARHYLGILLFNQGRHTDYSIRLLKEALALAPDNSEIRENLVEVLRRSGRRAEAESLRK